eukprot:NODE_805_length_692_cov_337.356143_g735_i0.p2 GENE.NODE_805_length_692_cov_337.356143_g735_i0~~NODE_805_length_692_cov_337.356143_g735_i0.p2  ORF type:complete len:188 (-),score=38.97 NODE_805_length_692_cov_337.356143_g735_i0:72-635(-)
MLTFRTAQGPVRRLARCCAAVSQKQDLFGYPLHSDTSTFRADIAKAKYYDEAGEIIVKLTMSKTAMDLETYNAVLERIHNCPSKCAQPVPGEDKFCAMMDTIEDMGRNGIKADLQSWTYVLQQLVNDGEFRLGWCAIATMKAEGLTPPDSLVSANDANAAKAKAAGQEFPHMAPPSHPLEVEVSANF